MISLFFDPRQRTDCVKMINKTKLDKKYIIVSGVELLYFLIRYTNPSPNEDSGLKVVFLFFMFSHSLGYARDSYETTLKG